MIYEDDLIIQNAIDIIKKLEKENNIYEIFNIFFLIQNSLTKEKFNNIINNMQNIDLKLNILKKLISVNSKELFYEDINDYNFYEEIEFNNQLNIFIKNINFL